MDLTRRMVLLDDTAAALRMVRAELATWEDAIAPVLMMEPDPSRTQISAEGRARVA